MKRDRLNKFSVLLGLLDYINPIFYSITIITIINNTYSGMGNPYKYILLMGAIISIIFGFIIPTGKVIVGLGLIKFRMPVSLVFCVNAGIFLLGLMLFRYVMNIKLIMLIIISLVIIGLLFKIYKKSKKVNTIAVLTGAIGYVMIYTSLIILSVRYELYYLLVLYVLAILLFIMLCGIGIKANLKNPKVHWVIEISNVVCQMLVAIATVILFK
ncbi:MAG: hypothetical protein VZS44_06360 [Bacilli bacterium]|nr:hypothetical protein [Bacilli bacterium]